MSTEDPQLEISGYPVERVRVGQHTLGHVVINEDVSVVFRMADGGDPTDIDSDCLICKLSKINDCAQAVCPDVKEHDPNASCSEEIKACIDIACRTSCTSAGFGGGGDILIIA